MGTPAGDTTGDRGLPHPELVVSAARGTMAVLDTRPADAYISANRTCEMGLLHATGRPYQSFFFLLEQLLARNGHRDWTMPDNQDMEAANPVMS